MKKLKNLLLVSLICSMFFTVNVYATVSSSAYYNYNVTMYAPDGRSISVARADVQAWKNVGWFEYPVVAMYAPDGRSIIVASTDVYTWENVGWIDGRKTAEIYALDGRRATVPLWQLQQYLNVGWYENPVGSPALSSSFYPGTNVPRYESVVWGRFIDSEQKYSNNGTLVYTYSYKSDFDNKNSYIDYLEQNGWEYYDSEVEDDNSSWYLVKDGKLISVTYYYSSENVLLIFN